MIWGWYCIKKNTRKFQYKKKGYVMITINGDKGEGTDCATINRQAWALNFMVSGVYIFV